MCYKLILFVTLLAFPSAALGQSTPYPDTAPTGNPQLDLQNANEAQSQLDENGREIEKNQKKFDGLKEIDDAIVAEDTKLKHETDGIVANWELQKNAFNGACTGRPIVVNSPQWVDCQKRKVQLGQLRQKSEGRNAEIGNEHQKLVQKQNANKSQGVLLQAQIQKLKNWRSQVEASLKALKTAAVGECKGLLQTASPEELKSKCGNIQFDKARANLPACIEPDCIKARILDFQ